jgi:MFS transporter, AAHS family, benzoate transport protein
LKKSTVSFAYFDTVDYQNLLNLLQLQWISLVRGGRENMNNTNQIGLNRNVNVIDTRHNTIPAKLTHLVLAICFFGIMAEGYDLGIYGAVLPKLLESKEWGLTPAQAGAIGSYALIGMLVGAVAVGTITDLIGRKWTFIWSIGLFSATMALSAVATSAEMFGVFRFIGGVGLGGIIPTASALTIEYSPKHRRSLNYAIMFSGYAIGTVIAVLLSLVLLTEFGWRILFWIGAIPILAIPFIIRYLPESVSFLISHNRVQEAEEICKRYQMNFPEESTNNDSEKQNYKNLLYGLSTLFSKKFAKATILFWITYVMSFYLIYGLNTWLPQIMRQLGHSLGSSLSFLLTLNLTAAIGVILGGAIADKWGSKKVISISYFLAALGMWLITVTKSEILAYLCIGITGFGTIANTQLLHAYLSKYFPATVRGTALGWGLGVGRIGAISGPILIGLFISMGFKELFSFYTFVVAGIIATIAILLVSNHHHNEII